MRSVVEKWSQYGLSLQTFIFGNSHPVTSPPSPNHSINSNIVLFADSLAARPPTPGVSGFIVSLFDSIVQQRLREIQRQRDKTLVYSRQVQVCRSKLERDYRKYDGLYKKWRVHMDQVMPTLIWETCHPRMRKDMKKMMSKWDYIISAREPIGGDEGPRR